MSETYSDQLIEIMTSPNGKDLVAITSVGNKTAQRILFKNFSKLPEKVAEDFKKFLKTEAVGFMCLDDRYLTYKITPEMAPLLIAFMETSREHDEGFYALFDLVMQGWVKSDTFLSSILEKQVDYESFRTVGTAKAYLLPSYKYALDLKNPTSLINSCIGTSDDVEFLTKIMTLLLSPNRTWGEVLSDDLIFSELSFEDSNKAVECWSSLYNHKELLYDENLIKLDRGKFFQVAHDYAHRHRFHEISKLKFKRVAEGLDLVRGSSHGFQFPYTREEIDKRYGVSGRIGYLVNENTLKTTNKWILHDICAYLYFLHGEKAMDNFLNLGNELSWNSSFVKAFNNILKYFDRGCHKEYDSLDLGLRIEGYLE